MSPDPLLLERAARGAAASFRLGMDAQASAALVAFVDALGDRPPADIEAVVAALLAAQVRGDTLYLADLLEHELLPRLLAPPVTP